MADARRAERFQDPAAEEPSGVATMLDAARACRGIAASLGASGYAVLLMAGSGERTKLVPMLDQEFPALAEATRLLCCPSADALRRHAARSSAPCFWRSPPSGTAPSRLAAELAPVLPDLDGIAFPVFASQGKDGLVVFSGRDLELADAALCEAHLASVALFGTVVRLAADARAGAPLISRRELECLRLTARGLTSEEIAASLGLSIHTANQYLANTAQKLDAVNRMHAVAKAMRLGLID